MARKATRTTKEGRALVPLHLTDEGRRLLALIFPLAKTFEGVLVGDGELHVAMVDLNGRHEVHTLTVTSIEDLG